MKKILRIIIAFAIVICAVSLISCGEKPLTETVFVYGEFCTLQEAYSNGWITEEQAKIISANEKTPENFSAIEESEREKILHDYKALHPAASDDIEIKSYGNYDGCNVVLITDNLYGNAFLETVRPNSHSFYYVYDQRLRRTVSSYSVDFYWVRVWKASKTSVQAEKPQMPTGAFLTYGKAYESGLFSEEDWNDREYVETSCDKEYTSEKWENTKNKIIDDYISLGIDNDYNSGIGIYDPSAGMYPSTGVYIPDVFYVGKLNGNAVVKVLTLYNSDPYQDEHDFEFSGFSYKDRYPPCIIWVPIEKLVGK